MKSTFFVYCCALLLFFAACDKKEASSEKPSSVTTKADSMKAAITATFDGLRTDNLDVLDKYYANDLIEHTSAIFRDGKIQENWPAGLKELIIAGRKKYTTAKVEVEAICVEGDICAVRYRTIDYFDADSTGHKEKHAINTAWFRWQNGKFVESWDAKDEEFSEKQ